MSNKLFDVPRRDSLDLERFASAHDLVVQHDARLQESPGLAACYRADLRAMLRYHEMAFRFGGSTLDDAKYYEQLTPDERRQLVVGSGVLAAIKTPGRGGDLYRLQQLDDSDQPVPLTGVQVCGFDGGEQFRRDKFDPEDVQVVVQLAEERDAFLRRGQVD